MSSGYRLSKSAEADLFAIWDYSVEVWGAAQAEKYLKQLEFRFIELANEPGKGQMRDDVLPDLLCYYESRHLIFYRRDDFGIEIARVLHERMDIQTRIEQDPGESS